MTKLLLFSLFHFIFNNNNDQLQKTRERYAKANSVTYKETAFYPNPDTDEVSSWTTFYTIYDPGKKDFEFESKSGNVQTFYKNEIFTEVRNDEKVYYRYEIISNQTEALESSRLKLYGPVSLLSKDWKYADETAMEGKKLSRYSVLQDEREYEGKKIKTEFNIYISPDNTVLQFDRKNYIDNKLSQTITYKFDDYIFDDSRKDFKVAIPERYAMKYFERIETLKPLAINTKAPVFEGFDLDNNKISFKTFPTNKTLLLFSSTNCGASKSITDFLNQSNLIFDNHIKLITILESNSIETAKKYSKKYKTNYPVIANRKDIEKEYGIAGYPMMYLIDERGLITNSFNGSEEILSYFKKPNN